MCKPAKNPVEMVFGICISEDDPLYTPLEKHFKDSIVYQLGLRDGIEAGRRFIGGGAPIAPERRAL